jgi:hypothetical protein
VPTTVKDPFAFIGYCLSPRPDRMILMLNLR